MAGRKGGTLALGSPMTVTANWRTDHIHLYVLIAGTVILVATTITVLYKFRKRIS